VKRAPLIVCAAAAALLALEWSPWLAAQIDPPNRSGVSMGHVHFVVRDLEASRRFWSVLGGKPTTAPESAAAFRFPGLLVLLSPGAPTSDGSGLVVDHVAFRTKSLTAALDAIKAAGFKTELANPLTARAYTPDGYKIELFDATSESPRYFPDPGQRDSDWERHMVPMTDAIVSQHIHYYLAAGVEAAAKAWYFERLGGTPGRRLQYAAVDLPGINLNFSVSSTPNAPPGRPTKGSTLDHVGFEVENLAAFCRKLEAAGVRFDTPYGKRGGLATASLVDPWGVSIELTEGLRGR